MVTTPEVPGSIGIPIRRSTTPRAKPDDSSLEFGTVFADHIYLQEWHLDRGWHDARIEPYGSFSLDPAACVLHYAQAIFDGLKAFRQPDGKVKLFRPRKHAERLINSARRMCIPPLEVEQIIQSFVTLVDLDRDWVPRSHGTSLYVRPTIVATEPYLGVRPSTSYLYFVILSPVGSYYGGGMQPVKILVADEYVRAVEGGVGAAKTAGNYAASLYAAEQAKHKGYAQVLWLDGVHRRYVDEVGTMNIMLRVGDEVLTPPLSGTILPGITRDSVLTILRDWGIPVAERPISIEDVVEAHARGTLREVWGTGTAAAISPVGELGYRDRQLVVNDGRIGELTQRLYDTLLGIQYGTQPDIFGWLHEI